MELTDLVNGIPSKTFISIYNIISIYELKDFITWKYRKDFKI